MKKILLLTPVYPAKDVHKSTTPVVHYFTREWVKMGYCVQVMHYAVNFPSIVYWAIRPFKDRIGSRVGSEVRTWPVNETNYSLEGVNVQRFPLTKTKPHSRYRKKEIDAAVLKTIRYCNEVEFSPDVIISHWANPSYEIMHQLKQYYHVPTCYIAHDIGTDLKTIFQKEAKDYIAETDLFGYRSGYIKQSFEEYFCNSEKPNFLCSSGIPEDYLCDKAKDFSQVKDFIFVGTLFKRKYPTEIILAVKNAYGEDDFKIRYVGDGEEVSTAKQLASDLRVESKVEFLGRMPRNEVVEQLDKSDVFIMISRSETFGLVYLEAMARGLITIASRKEGFDGIIQDGVNGFLCEAGNVTELETIIKRIRTMPSEELKKISQNAKSTAESLTDVKAACVYLNNVEKYCINAKE